MVGIARLIRERVPEMLCTCAGLRGEHYRIMYGLGITIAAVEGMEVYMYNRIIRKNM